MTDQELQPYFDSFIENIMHADSLTWIKIQHKQISKEEFTQAVRDWAADITANK